MFHLIDRLWSLYCTICDYAVLQHKLVTGDSYCRCYNYPFSCSCIQKLCIHENLSFLYLHDNFGPYTVPTPTNKYMIITKDDYINPSKYDQGGWLNKIHRQWMKLWLLSSDKINENVLKYDQHNDLLDRSRFLLKMVFPPKHIFAHTLFL